MIHTVKKDGVIAMLSRKLTDTIETNFEKYIDFLCHICAFEARATDKETIDRMVSFIADFAKGEGFCPKRTAMENCGDFLCIDMNEGAEKGGVFLAHMDTVHNKGVFGEVPVTRLADRIIAPGVIDCKGGIAISLLAMKALQENGCEKHIRLLLTSDEEVSNSLGGRKEVDYFTAHCTGFPCAINCETTEKDEVVISRKGILRYRIDITGKGGHSGIHYFQCKNAIAEAAHKIIALEGKSRRGGITYSCNIIEGGSALNIIPDRCTLSVDVRVPRHKDMETAARTVEEIASRSFLEGTSAVITPISTRPPMEKNADTMALYDALLDVCRRHGLGSLTPVESGGGSDSCYTQAAGVPSICGMGASGEFCHTNREYASIESIHRRAALLALFLSEQER